MMTSSSTQNENAGTPPSTPPTTLMKRPAGAAVSPQLAPKRPCLVLRPVNLFPQT
jgi:hypothetical protein